MGELVTTRTLLLPLGEGVNGRSAGLTSISPSASSQCSAAMRFWFGRDVAAWARRGVQEMASSITAKQPATASTPRPSTRARPGADSACQAVSSTPPTARPRNGIAAITYIALSELVEMLSRAADPS